MPKSMSKKTLTTVCIVLALAIIAGGLTTLFLVLANRPVTLRVAAKPQLITYFDENGLTKALEEKAKVKIDWADYGTDPFTTAKNNVGGQDEFMPDAYLGLGLSDAQIEELADELFLELTDEVLEGSKEYKDIIAANGEAIDGLRLDGKLYSYPSYKVEYAAQYPQKVWINKLWLDKIGAAVPTTPQELEAVLQKFKDEDPNGNGKKDEIPLGAAYTGTGYTTLGFVVSAFAKTDFDLSDNRSYFSLDADGKVISVADGEDYKAALTYLNGLYTKGLLDKDVFSANAQTLKNGTADEEIYGVIAASDLNNVLQDTVRASAYVALPPLDGGNKATVYKPSQLQGGGYIVASGLDKKEQKAALALGDALLSKELTLDLLTGGQWQEADEKSAALGGEEASWKLNDGAILQDPLAEANAKCAYWFDAELALSQQAKPDEDGSFNLQSAENWQGYLNKVSLQSYAPYGDAYLQYALTSLELTAEQEAALTKDGKDLRRQITDAVVKNARDFVTGARPLSEWSDYTAELSKLGIADVLKVFNEAIGK